MLKNAKLDSIEKVLLPKAFLRWNIPNDYQNAVTVFQKKEMNGKKSNFISVSVHELKFVNAMTRMLKHMLADTYQRKKRSEKHKETAKRKKEKQKKKENKFERFCQV
jgi:hypothetical protein